MLESSTQITVRYAETDMMGIVYHGNYLPWFEVGRTTLLKEQGLSYRELESAGFRLPVLEVGVKFLKPALYDDTLTIITTMAEKPVLRIQLAYEVYRGGELLATGQTAHAFIDREGRPVRPPPKFAQRMTELFAAKPS